MNDEPADIALDRFDLSAWAEARGIPDNRRRPARLAKMLGVTPDYIRKVIAGSRGPSKTVVLLALTLDRLGKLEADVARDRSERAAAALAHLGAQRDQLAVTSGELMAMTRGDNA
jgi:hypothetical protein